MDVRFKTYHQAGWVHVSTFSSIQKTYLVKREIDNFADWLQQSGSSAWCCRLGSHAWSVSVNPFSLSFLSPSSGSLHSPRLGCCDDKYSAAAAAVVATGWTVVIHRTHPPKSTKPTRELPRVTTFSFVQRPVGAQDVDFFLFSEESVRAAHTWRYRRDTRVCV